MINGNKYLFIKTLSTIFILLLASNITYSQTSDDEMVNNDNTDIIAINNEDDIKPTTNQDNLIKSNKLPVVNFDVSTVSGGVFEAPVWLKFYPSGTYDPDGYIVLFEIDMNGDGVFDVIESTLTGGSYEFTIPGNYVAIVRVTDDKGGISTKSESFTIGSPHLINKNESDFYEHIIEQDLPKPIIQDEPIDEELNKKLDSIIEDFKIEEPEIESTEIIKEEIYEEPVTENIVYTEPIILQEEIVIPDPVQYHETPEVENEEIEIGKIKEEPINFEKVTEPDIEVEIKEESFDKLFTLSDDSKISLIADSYVYAYSYRNWNDANFGKQDIITSGWHSTGGEKRTYLKFDLPNINFETLDKATLKLYHNNTIGNNSTIINIYQLLEDWNEGAGIIHEGLTEPVDSSGVVTWNLQPNFSDSVIVQFKPKKKYNRWIEIDITQIVKEWISGEPNYGIVLKPNGILSGRDPISLYEFYSKEFEDKSKTPYVEIQLK